MQPPARKPALPVHRAKLRHPRFVAGFVSRPHLAARLNAAPRVPLTLLSAPAGFGKTTLLTEWSATLPTPPAWLTADAGDRAVPRFVAHVAAAIESVVPHFGLSETAHDMLLGLHSQSAAEIGRALADAMLELPHDVLLVVDDYHLAASVDVEEAVAALVQIMPPAFHLVLATRNDPTLPLARMRLQGRLIELRGGDLLFTSNEAYTLLAAEGIVVDPALATLVQEMTGGWAAGLRLLALALPASDEPRRIADALTSERHVMDFLVEEVLSTLPVDVLAILLLAATVDRISAPLADALLDQQSRTGSRVVLEALTREGVFIEREDNSGLWFRARPLFRTLLQHQLEARLSDPERVALHVRAGAWFAGQGMVADAVHQYLAAGNESAAASTVERHARTALAREDWPSLAAWLELLPVDVVAARPLLLLVKAYVAHLSGRFAAGRDILAEVRTLLGRDAGVATVHRGMLAECDALELSQTLVLDQNPHAVSVTRDAVERIPADYRFARGIAYIACGMALQSAGRTDEAIGWLSTVADREAERVDAGSIRALMGLMFVYRQAGHYFECRQVSGHMLELADRHDLPVSSGWARWALGWIAYEHNELETAIAHFEAIAVDWQQQHFACFCEGMFGLALAYQASGMPLEAKVTMRQVTEAVRDQHAFPYLPSISLFEARLALIRGDMQSSLESINASDGSLAGNSLVTFEHEVISRARVLIAHGTAESLAVAHGDIERLFAAAASGHHQARLVEILALSALVHEALGQREMALTHLKRSLDLGAPAGFCRTYVDLGQSLVPLLEQLVTEARDGDDARRLLAVIKTEAPIGRPGVGSATISARNVFEMLTLREADVLDGLCRRLSYQEIAEELFISVHTVKSHTRHIYEKLGVANRRQAMSKSQALGVAPRGATAKRFS